MSRVALVLLFAFAYHCFANAQTVTITALAPIPDYTEELEDVARPVQAADGNLYGSLMYTAAVFRVSPAGQYTRISQNYVGFFRQEPDGNFYGAGTRLTPGGTVTTLHSFTGGSDGSGSVYSPTLASDGYFYGISEGNSSESDSGVFYRMSSSGGFQSLFTFARKDGDVGNGLTLVQATDGNLYGAAPFGGSCPETAYTERGCGTLFRLTTKGTISVLHTFSGGADGANPSDLVEGSDGSIYGSTFSGGDKTQGSGAGDGTIFRIDLQGNFSVLHTFEDGEVTPVGPYVAEAGGTLYGAGSSYYDGAFAFLNINGQVTPLSVQTSGNGSVAGLFDSPLTPSGTGYLYGVIGGNGQPDDLGSIVRLSYDPAITPSVQLTLGAAKVKPGAPVSASFSVNNAFSLSMQQCYGFQVLGGVVTPLGKAAGTYNSTTQLYTGSATLPAPTAPGYYSYALTCGGVESGYAALQAGSTTATKLAISKATVTRPTTATLTGTVTSPDGAVSGGTVTFQSEGVTIGSAPVNASGVAADGWLQRCSARNLCCRGHLQRDGSVHPVCLRYGECYSKVVHSRLPSVRFDAGHL